MMNLNSNKVFNLLLFTRGISTQFKTVEWSMKINNQCIILSKASKPLSKKVQTLLLTNSVENFYLDNFVVFLNIPLR